MEYIGIKGRIESEISSSLELITDMYKALNNELFSDLTIYVGDNLKKIHAHKSIIQSRWYFKTYTY